MNDLTETAESAAHRFAKEVIELRAKLEQAEKDARRYRWLRKLPSLSFDAGDCEWTGGYWPDALDAAIDAAMKEPHA